MNSKPAWAEKPIVTYLNDGTLFIAVFGMVEVSFWLRLLRAFGAKRKTISFRNAVLLDLGVGDNYKILLCYYILEENNNKFVIIKTKQRH